LCRSRLAQRLPSSLCACDRHLSNGLGTVAIGTSPRFLLWLFGCSHQLVFASGGIRIPKSFAIVPPSPQPSNTECHRRAPGPGSPHVRRGWCLGCRSPNPGRTDTVRSLGPRMNVGLKAKAIGRTCQRRPLLTGSRCIRGLSGPFLGYPSFFWVTSSGTRDLCDTTPNTNEAFSGETQDLIPSASYSQPTSRATINVKNITQLVRAKA
jgi:hypothetical protein